MIKRIFISLVLLGACLTMTFSQDSYDIDKFNTPDGELEIWCIGHGTLMLKLKDFVVHIDPVSREANYDKLPDADIILVSHSHGDHLDPGAIAAIRTPGTLVLCNKKSADRLEGAITMANGDKMDLSDQTGIAAAVEAVPAYNIRHERSPGNPFHPKGEGNGYIIELGGKRIYVGGDTENIPEMSDFGKIDIAFIPMNLPYTMSVDMAVDAASRIKPDYLYPYHYGSSDTDELIKKLGQTEIEVRIRNF